MLPPTPPKINPATGEWHAVSSCTSSTYRIAGNFDLFDTFPPDRQNLTRQIFKAIQRLVKDCDHPSKYFLLNI